MANEQIHLLQIAREALSNCARHSGADQVWVTLRQAGDALELLIEDDGCGLSGDYDQRQHHGTTIMQQRARQLQGQLSVTSRDPRGPRVHLKFKPGFLGNQPKGQIA